MLRQISHAAKRLLFMNRKRYTLKLNGKTIQFSTADPAAHRWFYPRYAFNRLHEKSMTLRMIEDFAQARCFVDLGANLGYYTCLAAHFMPAGHIFSFEMDADSYCMLVTNAALNRTDTAVEPFQVAVSDSSGTLSYFRPPDQSLPGLSLYQARQSEEQIQVEVQAITLDDFFSSRAVRPDLVKMDVEGAELDVLRGMTTLLPHISKLYLEVHPALLAAAGQSFGEIYEMLSRDFALYRIPDHRTQQTAALRRMEPGETPENNAIVFARRLPESQ
jgi:FkbM family methyltransferase